MSNELQDLINHSHHSDGDDQNQKRASSVVVQFVPLDVQSEQSIQEASHLIEQSLARNLDNSKSKSCDENHIHYLINNAGQFIPHETLDNVQYDQFMSSVATNTAGPLFLWQHLRHLLSNHNCKIVQIGSLMGSMGSITYSDGHPSYRCSKAALNMFNILVSNYYEQLRVKELKQRQKQEKMKANQNRKKEQKAQDTSGDDTALPIPYNVISVVMHPGHVQTDTGSWSRKKPPLTPDESVERMMNIIENLKLESSGKYLSFDGTEIPW